MLSSVGLEVMNPTNPELNWKAVTKGRRSRKSTARRLNSAAKAGNSTSPKRVGDFSGSDSDKFGGAVLGQSTSAKSENVPIKKRRHLLQTPSRRLELASSQTHHSSPGTEHHDQLTHPSCYSGPRSSNRQLRGIDFEKVGKRFDDIFSCEQTERGCNDAGDFSGIELLAAAASLDDNTDNASPKKEFVAEGGDSLMLKHSDPWNSAVQSKLGLECNESENSLSNETVNGGNIDNSLVTSHSPTVPRSLCRSPEDGTVPKVNRQHWDLNAPMDAWEEPYDDSISGNTSKDANDGILMGEGQKASSDHVPCNPGGTGDKSTILKMEENKLATVAQDRTCSEPSCLVECLPDPPVVSCSNIEREASIEDTHKEVDEKNSDHVLSCDTRKETLNQVLNTDAICGSSLTELSSSTGRPMPEEKISTTLGNVTVTHDEDWSSNVNESGRAASDEIQTMTPHIIASDMPANQISETAIVVQCKDIKDSWNPCELPGTIVQGAPSVIADSMTQNDGIVPGSVINDCQGHIQLAEAKHEDNSLPTEGPGGAMMEDSCKSFSAGAQCDDPTSSVGKIGCAVDAQHDSDVTQYNHFQKVDEDGLAMCHVGYDSPYEDGELRGSYYSWEDNELENECVDYESDGRNGDSSDVADYPGSEIVEDGSEGSHGPRKRSSSVKRLQEGNGSKSGHVKHSLRRYCVKDDSDNNEIAGKGSNAGSGTTVEQSMEMNVEKDDDVVKRRQLTGRRDTVEVNMAQMDEYTSKTARGKLQSRIEGRSSLDFTDGKDVLFVQRCRSRRASVSYPRTEGDMSPDKHLGRHRPAAHGERDGVHQWTSWGSRRRYTSRYQGTVGPNTRPRSMIGDLDKIGGLDLHDPRQTANHLPRGLHRPLMKSPAERDDYFGVRKRMPITRGVSSHRSRGHYSQRMGRDFGEDCEPLPDDAGASGRLSRYISRRDQSFSPSSVRSAHMPLPRRRSRSRSRTRSPRALHPHRERILNVRRPSRSPDFRPEARVERIRVPFTKPTFASDYGDGYISPPRGRFSPQRNYRWLDDRTFAENHVRRRRSPVRVFRRTQRLDPVNSSGRMKSNEYFRPMIRPGRFSFMANGGGRECKFESSYDGRRRDDSAEMMHRGLYSDDGGNIRRFRHNGADDFETSNLNNRADVRVTDPRDVPQAQSDREDKRAFKI